MNRLNDLTLGDIGKALSRYLPFIALATAVVLVMVALPGNVEERSDDDFSGPGRVSAGGDNDVELGGDFEEENGTEFAADGTPLDTEGRGGSEGARRRTRSATGGSFDTSVPAAPKGAVANCDSKTGRIMIPTRYAPICVPSFDGSNAGATHQGVTRDKIVVAVYRAEDNPAADAILAAAGSDDSEEEIRQQYRDWVAFYEAHFNTWGRKVELHFVEASGKATDDAAGKADAIRVATEIKAFASWGAPNNTYIDEVVARGVLCFCSVSQPIEFYLDRAPFVWSTLMASTQGYVHRAEYIGKRVAHQKAAHAGDPIFQQQNRKFGLLYYETKDGAYKAGADFFVKELSKYNVKLAIPPLAYTGYPDLAANQEQARPLIQKLKDAGVTSVIFAGDPFGPIFFTQEATRQAYRPEWIITGSALTDTSFFARTYDQEQWSHAFGISFLTARLPEEFGDSFRLLNWHFGRGPSAPGSYGVIRSPIDIFYNGVHLAGEALTPRTFRNGMFSMPITGAGGITDVAISYGRKGIWPWDDYLAYDDVTEIWWDRSAQGEDEIGNDGVGMYRYVDGGIRYLPTKHPNAPNKAFIVEGTVLVYNEPPPQDRWPEYPPPKRD